jgi:hypothetical protein
MVAFPALRVVAVLALLTPIAGGAALSAALVGETGRVEVVPVPEQPLDQIKTVSSAGHNPLSRGQSIHACQGFAWSDAVF